MKIRKAGVRSLAGSDNFLILPAFAINKNLLSFAENTRQSCRVQAYRK
jgi:hypothetical protein